MSWFPSIRPMARSLSAVSGWVGSAGLMLAVGCVAGPAAVPQGGLMAEGPPPCTSEACPPTGHAKRAKHEKHKPHASEELVASSTVKPPTARFHPVPTRPVFSPKPGDPPPTLLGSPPEGEFGPPLVSPGELIPAPAPTLQTPTLQAPGQDTQPQPPTAMRSAAPQQAAMTFPPPPMPGSGTPSAAAVAGPSMPSKPGFESPGQPVAGQAAMPASHMAATRVPSSMTLKSSSPAIAGLRAAPNALQPAGKSSPPVSLALAAQSPVAQVTAEVEKPSGTFAVIPGGSAAMYLQTQKAPVLSDVPVAAPVPTGMSLSVPAQMPPPVQTAMAVPTTAPSSASTPEMPESKLATMTAYRDAKASVLAEPSPVKLASSETPVPSKLDLNKPEPSTRFLAPPAPVEIVAATTSSDPALNVPALNAPLNDVANGPQTVARQSKSSGEPTPAKKPAALVAANESASVGAEPVLAAPTVASLPSTPPSNPSTASNWEQRSLVPTTSSESKSEANANVETGWKARR